jgi:hypothetical protein
MGNPFERAGFFILWRCLRPGFRLHAVLASIPNATDACIYAFGNMKTCVMRLTSTDNQLYSGRPPFNHKTSQMLQVRAADVLSTATAH